MIAIVFCFFREFFRKIDLLCLPQISFYLKSVSIRNKKVMQANSSKRNRSYFAENWTFPAIVVRLSLRSFLCSSLTRLAVNGTALNSAENWTFPAIVVRLSLRSFLCSAGKKKLHFLYSFTIILGGDLGIVVLAWYVEHENHVTWTI